MSDKNHLKLVDSLTFSELKDLMPKPGAPLMEDDFNDLTQAYATRRRNFPNEKIEMSLGLILFNLGERYATVVCDTLHSNNRFWMSLKKDVVVNGVPVCPMGHRLQVVKKGMRLAWVNEPEDDVTNKTSS